MTCPGDRNIDEGEFFVAMHVIGWLMSMGFVAMYVFFLGNVMAALPFNYYLAVSALTSRKEQGVRG